VIDGFYLFFIFNVPLFVLIVCKKFKQVYLFVLNVNKLNASFYMFIDGVDKPKVHNITEFV